MQTVQTVTTVRTFRRTAYAPRQIVTRRTTVSQLVAAPRTLYDYAGPAAAVAAPTYNTAAYYGSGYARPLYDYAYGSGYARPLYDYALRRRLLPLRSWKAWATIARSMIR